MGEIKLTKTALRDQQSRLNQLERYLPTLQLKKSMLQIEVNNVRAELLSLEERFNEKRLNVTLFGKLFSMHFGINVSQAVKVDHVEKEYENIAGIEIPRLKGLVFAPFEYSLFDTPPWLDFAIEELKGMLLAKSEVLIADEKRHALEKELREVSIRLNLFEKSLIPRAKSNIKKIKVFLCDQELAAVGQAKVAKSKIEKREHEN